MDSNNLTIQEARRMENRKLEMRRFVKSIPENIRGYDPVELLDAKSSYDKITKTGKFTLRTYLDEPTLFLILHGASGLGKSALAVGLAYELLRRDFGVTGHYIEVTKLLTQFSFGSDNRSREAILNSVVRPDVLVLDDVGAGSDLNTDTRINYMQNLISERWNYNRYTIMTTNLAVGRSDFSVNGSSSIQDWFGESAWDRIAGSPTSGNANLTRVEFKGRTMRGQGERANFRR